MPSLPPVSPPVSPQLSPRTKTKTPWRTVRCRWVVFVWFLAAPRCFFWFGKKTEACGGKGWLEWRVRCFFVGFDCFVLIFFVFSWSVMIFNCWSKLLASSLSYTKHNMQETPGTWTNRYPSKREAVCLKVSPVKHTLKKTALHPLNFRKGAIISNSKNGKDIYNILFRSLRTQCFRDSWLQFSHLDLSV